MQSINFPRSIFSTLVLIIAGTLSASANTTWAIQRDGTQMSAEKSGDISEKFSPAKIKFEPCQEDPDLDCGTLTVPVDYSQPHGETFGIAVIRARVTNPEKRIGVLIMNGGGPGLSGVDLVRTGVKVPAFILVRERFDIISFDVRGSHRSRKVRCNVEPVGLPNDLNDEALASFFDEFSRRVATACLEQNGPFVTTLSSNNIARDMNVLRQALGEKQITYIGLSYGTTIGAIHASLFPKHVRGMILDAGLAPEFRDALVEFWSEHSRGFEIAFRRLDHLCRRDSACRLKDTGVLQAFDTVMAKVKDEPVTSPQGAVLTDADIRNVVGEMLYREPLWPVIVDALGTALAGDYTLFFQFASSLAPAGEDGTPLALNTKTFTAHTAIFCNDYGTRQSANEYLPVDEAVSSLQSRLYGRFFVASGVGRCAAWPKADPPIIRNVKDRLKTPLLMVGNDFDNSTPLSWTRSLAHALGMERSVVRYQGGGHGVLTSGNPCIGGIAVPYLFNLTLPDEGSSCAAQPIQFGSSANRKASNR